MTPARPGSGGGRSQGSGETPLRDLRAVAAPSPWEPADDDRGSEGLSNGRHRQGSGSSLRPGSSRVASRQGLSSGSNGRALWDGSSTPAMPAAATPGSSRSMAPGSSTAASGVGRVRFEVEASPALTPTWKSTSWSRQKKDGTSGAEGDDSPKLGEDGAGEFDEALKREAELEEIQLERDWYDNEEFGGANAANTAHNPFVGDDTLFKKREAEMQQRMKRRDGSVMSLAASKRANELEQALNAWEDNRLITSGVVKLRQVNLDFDDNEDARVLLLIHDTKPPFLEGKVFSGKAGGVVLPLKDSTSDMAVIARNGSALVKEVREKKDKDKSRLRFWDMAGSKMGQITGLTEDERTDQTKRAEQAVRKLSVATPLATSFLLVPLFRQCMYAA
eukprot:GHRR01008688.1.p1 GENE.GHRR01008688.1~~GHRR01008688.1.p1  ORF type:complete len:458 (+),score=154.24 GHRR01008688.1:206-1375(+)